MEFDVRAVNAQLVRPKRQRRLAGLAAVGFMYGIVALLWFFYEKSIGTGSASRIDLALIVLLGAIGFATATLFTVVKGWRNLAPGAESLRCCDTGLEFKYPNGRVDRIAWTDPDLSFRLLDFSGANPKLLLSSAPYLIVARNTGTALTPEAFHAILAEVQARGLIERSERGSRWVFGTQASPLIYHVRGRDRGDPHVADVSVASTKV